MAASQTASYTIPIYQADGGSASIGSEAAALTQLQQQAESPSPSAPGQNVVGLQNILQGGSAQLGLIDTLQTQQFLNNYNQGLLPFTGASYSQQILGTTQTQDTNNNASVNTIPLTPLTNSGISKTTNEGLTTLQDTANSDSTLTTAVLSTLTDVVQGLKKLDNSVSGEFSEFLNGLKDLVGNVLPGSDSTVVKVFTSPINYGVSGAEYVGTKISSAVTDVAKSVNLSPSTFNSIGQSITNLGNATGITSVINGIVQGGETALQTAESLVGINTFKTADAASAFLLQQFQGVINSQLAITALTTANASTGELEVSPVENVVAQAIEVNKNAVVNQAQAPITVSNNNNVDNSTNGDFDPPPIDSSLAGSPVYALGNINIPNGSGAIYINEADFLNSSLNPSLPSLVDPNNWSPLYVDPASVDYSSIAGNTPALAILQNNLTGHTTVIQINPLAGSGKGPVIIQAGVSTTTTTNFVTPTTISISPLVIPDAVTGSAYAGVTFTATGGTSPYTYSVNNNVTGTTQPTFVGTNQVYFVNLVGNLGTEGSIGYKPDWGPTNLGGYFYQQPIIIQANPNAGHTFSSWTVLNADGTPFGDIDTSVDGEVSFYMPPNNVIVIANYDGNTSIAANYTLPSGLPAGLTLNPTTGALAGTPTQTAGRYSFTIIATDHNGNVGSQDYNINILAAAKTSSIVPTITPVQPTPDNFNPRYIQGISKIQPGVPSTYGEASAQYVGAEFVNTKGQPVVVIVQDFNNLYTGGTSYIPKGTNVVLYDSAGNPLSTAYSAGDVYTLTLTYTPQNDTEVHTVTVTTDGNGTAWEPVTMLSATGTGRIVQGSVRAPCYGPNVGGNGTGLYCGGHLANTYVRSVDIKSSYDYVLESSKYFTFRTVDNSVTDNPGYTQGYHNPYYGILIPAATSSYPNNIGTPGNGSGLEIGFNSINNATGTPYADKILNTITEFSIVDPLIQSITPLELYTPYTFAITNQPVWIQTIVPYTFAPNGYGSFRVDWGDGTVETLTVTAPTKEYYFTHAYSQPSDTPYTVIVYGYDAVTNGLIHTTTLQSQFYIQDSFPEISLTDYALNINTPKLPYSFEQIKVGSNEWAVANNINTSFIKLYNNFLHLNNIAKTIRKSPNFECIEWLGDTIHGKSVSDASPSYPLYTTWNTPYTQVANTSPVVYSITLSSNYYGVTPGAIVDYKSYRSPYSAPDYYQYITYTDTSMNSLIEIRKNDFYNTKVLALSSIIPSSLNFSVYSTEVSGNNMYVLATQNISQNENPVTLYRFLIDYPNNTALIQNQIGGDAGSINDPYKFGAQALPGNSLYPTEIKLFRDNVYVADKTNGCIKVYNSALTYQNTIYNNLLSHYDITTFDVNQNNGYLFVYGTIRKPNAPVITSITSQLTGSGLTQYSITWNHDGNRLASYNGQNYNFSLSGQSADTGNYTYIDSVYSDLTTFTDLPKLTTFVFSTSAVYTNFKVQALGYEGYASTPSSNIVVPTQQAFPSPYVVFVFDSQYHTIKLLETPEVPPTANIRKILVEPTGVFFYVVTDTYIYKYTTTGIYVNRINDPSSDTLNEPIVNAFINDRSYIYIVTASRIFKFLDIPSTESIIDSTTVSSYYNPVSSYFIGSSELIQDWVYNRAIGKIVNDHDILAKSISTKYVTVLDTDDNIVSFTTRPLSGSETIVSLSATENTYIHSNEIVSAAVVNRALQSIYNAQVAILSAITPEVITQEAYFEQNIVLGKNQHTDSNVIYQFIAPQPYFLSQPVSQTAVADNTVTLTSIANSYYGASALTYQWYYDNTAVAGASAATYTFTAELANAGTYFVTATDPVGTVMSNTVQLGVGLQTIFSFASATFVGNLYSHLFPSSTITPIDPGDGTTPEGKNWLSTRYNNDYSADVSLINATSATQLVIQLQETTTTNFPLTVYLTVSYNNSPIYTAQTTTAHTYYIPLSSYLTIDSSSVYPDGYPGTFAGTFTVSLAIDLATSATYSIPSTVVTTCNGGVLYNATFTNSLMTNNSTNTFNSTYMTLSGLNITTVPHISIGNNTLGGYINTGVPNYVTHAWSLATPATNLGHPVTITQSPVANYITNSTGYLTLSATRRNALGESELVLNMGRTNVSAPAVPVYTITGITGSVSNGAGYVTGTGSFKAGTIQTLHGVGTYYVNDYGPGQTTSTPIIIQGAGIMEPGRWYTASSPGATPLVITAEGTSAGSNYSACRFQVFVDNDKSVQVYFHH